MIKREITPFIKTDLKKKIIFVMGPRQTGKTTLSKLITSSYDYLNYDLYEHRQKLIHKQWDREKKLIIFDEIHKMKEWKRWLKGLYDVEEYSSQIIVTGSGRLDMYKNVGDSMAGRYFKYSLYPFDLKELHQANPSLNMNQA